LVRHQAFYEFLPSDGPQYLAFPYRVQGGDRVEAAVQAEVSGQQFTRSLRDVSHGWAFSTTQTQSQPEGTLSSAEWIVESPPYDQQDRTPLLPFGTLSFAHCPANGRPIPAGPTTFRYVMTNASGPRERARPGPLAPDCSTFAFTWVSGQA